MNVLIAIDGSKEAKTAVETANRLLSIGNRHLDLLCVASKPRSKGTSKVHQNDFEKRLLRQITHVLTQARASLPTNGVTVKLIPEIGSPSASIVNRTEDYDLTVIGSKDRRATGESGLGPIASRVVEHATGALLVAREVKGEGGIRVLIAVDGSTASLHAVETLTSLFDINSAEVCLMHVAETPWIELGPEEDWATYSEEDKEQSETGVMERELVREGETVLERARDLLRSDRLSVTTRIDEGNPANEILSEAERGQYDLVVVGATGGRDLKHRMLGSVSAKVAWNAPCSVLIVREPE